MRPTVGARERQRWDELMGAHHYLPFRTLVGRSMRHVAVLGERWLALVGWQAGAFKLRPRDEWIGWLPEQQFRRLHLIANNSRFVILPEAQGTMNLASRVLGLSLRRLSGDFRAMHGHPILIAETFIDPSRFTGACYRAANWQALGRTKGFSRNPGMPVTWTAHGRPKEIFVYPLVPNAREQLRALDDAAHWRSEGEPMALSANRMGSLFECLNHGRGVPGPARTALSVGHRVGHRDGGEARRIPWRDCVRRVRPSVVPRATARPSRLLQPSPGALHRPDRHHLPQHPHRAGPRRARPRGAHLGRPAKHRRGARGHRREVRARRRTAKPRRAKPPRRRRRALLRTSSSDKKRSPTRATRSPPSAP